MTLKDILSASELSGLNCLVFINDKKIINYDTTMELKCYELVNHNENDLYIKIYTQVQPLVSYLLYMVKPFMKEIKYGRC